MRCAGIFFVFLSLNGYRFGRECFEVVALRRLDRTATPAAHRFAEFWCAPQLSAS
jgi:hypothetical protein